MLESKHNIIRSIFLRLSDAGNNHKIAAMKAVNVSNDLYGNEILSSFELARGFNKPFQSSSQLKVIPNDLVTAQEQLQAKCKLTLILRSIATTELPIAVGDSV